MAIFKGQIAAALAAGNAVLAKPAEPTPLIANYVSRMLHQAGVPRSALQILVGNGAVGAALTRDAQLNGVALPAQWPPLDIFAMRWPPICTPEPL